MKTKRIVITGGPSTGKTAVIEALEEDGYYCHEEIIRAMTLAQKKANSQLNFTSNPIVSVEDPKAFNQRILDARIAQYNVLEKTTKNCIFYDRGIPDVLAYMNCFDQNYEEHFTEACKNYNYDLVFLMPPWKAIYKNDGERFETFEESLRINDCLYNTYTSLGYEIVLVPEDTVSNRVHFIVNTIKNKCE